jgi:type 2 lantibiotic biosynthesis protein LanM
MNFDNKQIKRIVEKSSDIYERQQNSYVASGESNEDSVINARINEWCEVVSGGNKEIFERRLNWDGWDLSTVRHFLGSAQIPDDQPLPKWAKTLDEVISASALFDIESLETDTLEENRFIIRESPMPFEEVFVPFVYVAKQRLTANIGAYQQLLSYEAQSSLERILLKRLSNLSSQTLGLEFSTFRASRESSALQRLKRAETAPSRKHYKYFIKHLLDSGLMALFEEYPVWARLVATIIDQWVDTGLEFLERLRSDWSEIEQTFSNGTELKQVMDFNSYLSDFHNNGHTVSTIEFTSGVKIVYKPKDSVAMEEVYFKLLNWFNNNGTPLTFKTIKIINRSSYAWVEFVEYQSCTTEQELERYYQRFGMILCLVYALGGEDLHHENIIACGEHPVLIDLETLMHNEFLITRDNEGGRDARSIAHEKLGKSVLSSGLLPQGEFIYISGLAGNKELNKLFKIQVLSNVNTDNMHLVYDEISEKTQQKNIPSLKGDMVDLEYHIEEIVDGFKHMFLYLMVQKEALLSTCSPLTLLKHQRVRIILRPTMAYSLIMIKSLNPMFLRDGVDRSIQLDILSRQFLLEGNQEKPLMWPSVMLEYQALNRLDIPLFTSFSDNTRFDIATGIYIENCFNKTSFNIAISRIENLNDEDLEQQVGFIRGLLYSHIHKGAHSPSLPEKSILFIDNKPVTDENVFLTQDELIENAVAIGETLQRSAIYSSDGGATWIAPQSIQVSQSLQSKIGLQPIDYGLYEGLCGIAFFLSALEHVTGSTAFHNLALSTLHSLHQEINKPNFIPSYNGSEIGGADGLGSIIYALVRISQFIDEITILEDAKKAASLITHSAIDNDNSFDIMSGSAGTILGLLALYDVSSDSDVLKTAIYCGEHLLNNRVTSESGYNAWITLNGRLLTGFSHGASGIAYALLLLYKHTGMTAFLEAAEEGIAYERSVFLDKQNNWPDLRRPSSKGRPAITPSWCQGAPGIGLARVAGLNILDSAEIRQDITAAIKATKQQKLLSIDYLCCGNMGSIDFLLTAGQDLYQPELVEVAKKRAAIVMIRAKQRGYYNYSLPLKFHPGLFTGSSGIGYELLRLAYPDQLPSVLLWE